MSILYVKNDRNTQQLISMCESLRTNVTIALSQDNASRCEADINSSLNGRNLLHHDSLLNNGRIFNDNGLLNNDRHAHNIPEP
jgi:hypothetical protein